MRAVRGLIAGCLLIAAAYAVSASSADSTVLRAKVIAYNSGSAFAVLDPAEKLKRIKLTGIDAPERTQRFGAQARQLAGEWLGAAAIEITIDKTDKDGRIFGRVSVDGRDVGYELLKAGLAWCDPADAEHIPAALGDRYAQECAQAKAQRRGLWIDANPIPPWEHRKIPQFAPLPGSEGPSAKSCQEIGYQTVQCDDGKTYRVIGSQIQGSDGTTYTKRGNTLSGSDGSRFEQQGSSIYGSDGSVCRTRGRRTDCY